MITSAAAMSIDFNSHCLLFYMSGQLIQRLALYVMLRNEKEEAKNVYDLDYMKFL